MKKKILKRKVVKLKKQKSKISILSQLNIKKYKISDIMKKGYSEFELKNTYTEHNYKKFIQNNKKYFLFEILSEDPPIILLNLFKNNEIIDSILVKITDEKLLLKIAIILGLETNEDVDIIEYLKWMEEDEKYPHPYDDWKKIKRILK